MIAVDTNVMVYLVAGGDRGATAARILEEDPEWAAPRILVSELQNVLVGLVRREVVSVDDGLAMRADAADVLADRIVAVPGDEVVRTALECGLSAYDAEFVVAARRLGVPLVSADRAIVEGAPDVAVQLEEV